MKNFIRILVLLILLATNVYLFSRLDKSFFKNITGFIYYSPCNTAISYRLGSIHPKFNIPRDNFFSYTHQATEIWNNAEGRKLFTYNKDAILTINLVYDERQALNQQISELQSGLKAEKGLVKPEIEEYQRRSGEFKKRLDILNAEIESWNEKGGAPQEEYTRLTKEQEELKKEADILNEMARKLNRSTESYNAKVKTLNQTIQSFNLALNLRPEEGIYIASENRIDIYLHNNKNELIHTLSHELGHVLRLNHFTNEKAIMYPYTTEHIIPVFEEALELSKICQEKNIFGIFSERLFMNLSNLQSKTSELIGNLF